MPKATRVDPPRSANRSRVLRLGRRPAPLPSVRRPPGAGRVLVLSASVGLGHEGAARELARRLDTLGLDVELRDYMHALPGPVAHALRDLYRPMVQYWPWAFDRIFHDLEGPSVVRSATRRFCEWALPTLQEWTHDADLVVTTYPLAGQSLGMLRVAGQMPATTVVYLTDPAAHAFWCHPAVDVHLAATHAAARDAERYGIRAQVAGPLCAPRFGRVAGARDRVRAELGLPPDAPAVLVSSGSLGMGAVPNTVSAILEHPRAHAVVLCGRSRALMEPLERMDRVVPLGWRDDVPELMAAADVLVHNAGGLSLTEALVSGLPAVTYLPIPGHGRANAEVLEASGVAGWARDTAELTRLIDQAHRTGAAPAAWPSGADPAVAVEQLLNVDGVRASGF